MKLIFIRHGDPDYNIDGLTEKGKKEAELLSLRVQKWDNISEIYVSPLGRAKETASYSLQKLQREGTEVEWLKEFYYPTFHPEDKKMHVPWDFYPIYWKDSSCVYDKDHWTEYKYFKDLDLKTEYEKVCNGIDSILEKHGIVREGAGYVSKESKEDDNIVFFCHLGVSCIILGHLLGISPFVLLHTVFIPTTSVTVVGTELRDGINVNFRTQVIGDTGHLRMGNEPVSQSGYFTKPFQG